MKTFMKLRGTEIILEQADEDGKVLAIATGSPEVSQKHAKLLELVGPCPDVSPLEDD